MATRRYRVLTLFVASALLSLGMMPAPLPAFAASTQTILVPLEQPTIQAGIDASGNGATVIVSPGVYHENINFDGKAVRVVSQGGPADTIILGAPGSAVATFESGEAAAATLEGFTITEGPDTPPVYNGGGVFIQGASPTIEGDVITGDDSCGRGGGVIVNGGDPIIVENVITHDTDSCHNTSGAIGITGGFSQVGLNVIAFNNSDGIDINGAYDVGAALADNLVYSNDGAGISASGSVEIAQNLVVDNGNGITVGSQGPGTTYPTIVGNTVAYNLEDQLRLDGPMTAMPVDNNILVGSFAVSPVSCPPQPLVAPAMAAAPVFSHNDVWSPYTPTTTGACAIVGSSGDISADPDFTASYQLGPDSPAVDAGTNLAPDILPEDLALMAREVDGNGDGVATIDMGAYERQLHPVEPRVAPATVLRVPAQYPSIQQGIDAATDGDIVLVSPGTYQEHLVYGGKSIVVKSIAGPGVTTIDGGNDGPAVTFAGGESRSAVLEGFTVTHGNGGIVISNGSPSIVDNVIADNVSNLGAGISYNGSPLILGNVIIGNTQSGSGVGFEGIDGYGGAPVIAANAIADNDGGVKVELGSETLVMDNAIAGNIQTGVDLEASAGATVIQNVVVDNNDGGITAAVSTDAGETQTIVNNTIVGNSGSQMYLSGATGTDTITNNILSGPYPLYCDSNIVQAPAFSHNALNPLGTSAVTGPCPGATGSTGNIVTPPEFASGTFEPALGSLCINAGSNTAPFVLPTDVAGRTRIVGGIIDIGAYENQQAA